jgi:signal transduction histidine kinase
MAHDAQVLTSGQPLTLNEEFQGPDNERRIVEITRCPIPDPHGEINGVQGILLDITDRVRAETERHRMEIQLRHAQKLEAIGQLAAGIAHEINTPTQYIGDNTRFVRDAFLDLPRLHDLYSRLLSVARDRNVDPQLMAQIEDLTRAIDLDFLNEQIPTALEQTLEGVNRVTNIVRAMKEFSHPGTDAKTPTDLNRAIESTITVSRNEWKYVADVSLDLDPDLPAVPCLPGEFNQVTLNLVINAAHAIADVVRQQPGMKGTIAVATRRLGDRVEIRVSDTGTGIPPEARSRIFEPFFTTKPVGRGTGQGLAIAHSVIVEKHGGAIRFETETAKGTTFIIELPLEASVRATPPSPAT